MALAIQFQDMIQRGDARDYADLARLGCLTRERMSQIMELSGSRRTSSRRSWSFRPEQDGAISRSVKWRHGESRRVWTGQSSGSYGVS